MIGNLDSPGDKATKYKQPLAIGLLAGLGLFILYFGVLSLAEGPAHAFHQLEQLWPWIAALILGFSLQAGLYWYVRQEVQRRMATGAGATLAATGAISTGSMVACCAHHLTDILPLLGLSAAAAFLASYQSFFLSLGIWSNAIGITIMLGTVQKHKLYDSSNNAMRVLLVPDMALVRKLTIGAGAILFPVVLVASLLGQGSGSGREIPPATALPSGQSWGGDLPTLYDQRKGVAISVTPGELRSGLPLRFDIALETHEGDLDFDLTGIALVEDSQGNLYRPQAWEGSPPGGHHRSGVLVFPPLKGEATSFSLKLKDVYGIPERTFEWTLR